MKKRIWAPVTIAVWGDTCDERCCGYDYGMCVRFLKVNGCPRTLKWDAQAERYWRWRTETTRF